MSESLYQLTGAYLALLDVAASGDDITEALAQLDDRIEAKAAGVVKVLAQLDADEAAAASEAKRLAGRAQVYAKSSERLRQHLKECMLAARITKIRSPQFSITLSAGQAKVIITDPDKVPTDLVHVETVRTPDKRAILAEFKQNGVVPPGCDIQETHKLTVR